MNDTIIAVMAKRPLVGKTKTRLSPPLDLVQAAGLYEALMLDSLSLAGGITGVDLAVALTPGDSTDYFLSVTQPGTLLLPVEGENIGKCLEITLERLFIDGYRKVLALNSDGPSLPPGFLIQAVRGLDEHDIVLGPNDDGGYYLIGMKKPNPVIFEGIDWSTNRVFYQTLQKASQSGLSVARLPAWYDIDTVDDLYRLQAELTQLEPEALPHTRRYLADSKL